jgi:hypothetical protein
MRRSCSLRREFLPCDTAEKEREKVFNTLDRFLKRAIEHVFLIGV